MPLVFQGCYALSVKTLTIQIRSTVCMYVCVCTHSDCLPVGQSKLSESNALGEAIEPVDIYGPEGIRDYIRTALQLTYSRIATPFRVHELKGSMIQKSYCKCM